jgi:hypothetical protein
VRDVRFRNLLRHQQQIRHTISRIVRLNGLSEGVEDRGQVGEIRWLQQRALEPEQEILLAAGTSEIVVAEAVAGPNVGERQLAVQMVWSGAQVETVRPVGKAVSGIGDGLWIDNVDPSELPHSSPGS